MPVTNKDSLDISNYPKAHQKYLLEEERRAIEFVRGAKSVIDIGCGTGRIIPKIAPLVGRYVGVDISEDYLKEAKKHTKGFNNVELYCMDAKDIAKKFTKEFDKALCLWATLSIMKSDASVLSDMAAIVTKGAFFSVNKKGSLAKRITYYNALKIPFTVDYKTETISSPAWGKVPVYTKSQVVDLVKKTDFSMEKLVRVAGIAYLVYCKKMP